MSPTGARSGQCSLTPRRQRTSLLYSPPLSTATMRISGAVASLAVLCVLAAAVEARSARSALGDEGDNYCRACVDGKNPQYRLIRGGAEVRDCEDGYYCDCQAGTKLHCDKWLLMSQKFDQDSGKCEVRFDCQQWMDKNPTPDPTEGTTAGTSTNAPTTGSSTSKPSPGTSTNAPTTGSSSKPSPGTSTNAPTPATSPKTSAPATSPKTPAPATSPKTPAPGTSPKTPAPGTSPKTPEPGTTPKPTPKPNGASVGQQSAFGLLVLGAALALL